MNADHTVRCLIASGEIYFDKSKGTDGQEVKLLRVKESGAPSLRAEGIELIETTGRDALISEPSLRKTIGDAKTTELLERVAIVEQTTSEWAAKALKDGLKDLLRGRDKPRSRGM